MNKQVREMNTITYSFADGTKQVQPINKEVYFAERNRKRSFAEILEIFKSTASDKKAVSFVIDADEEFTVNKEVKETFTAKERYNAKRDYREFRKNVVEFSKDRNKFIGYLTDKLSGKLKFNLTGLAMLN